MPLMGVISHTVSTIPLSMRFKILLSCILFFSLLKTSAQENVISTNLFDLRQHQLGVNIAPAIAELAGGANNRPRYAIHYKSVAENNGLRFSASWTDVKPTLSTKTIEIEENLVVLQEHATHLDLFDLRAGYEIYLGEKGWIVLGADAILGFRRVDERTNYSSVVGQFQTSDLANIPVADQPPLSTRYNTIGFSPFVGAKVDLGSSWTLQANTGLDFLYNKIVSPITSKEGNFAEFRYNLIDQIVLSYKF